MVMHRCISTRVAIIITLPYTINRTVNIADAGTIYSLYTSLLCSLLATTVAMATYRLTLGCRKTPSLVISIALALEQY